MSRRWTICLGMTALLAVGSAAPGVEPPRRLLIEFGWDEPDTAFLRAHAAEMARSPFDGCVFHAVARRSDGPAENFSWKGWGRRAYTEAELAQARDDLKGTRFGRFSHNFLRFNTAPADLDWFDDPSAVLANARLAAGLARAGGCLGVLLDTEQYEGPLFDYARQKDASKKSWDEYAAQVKRRGREVMEAFQEGMPGLTVVLTFGPSYAAVLAERSGVEPRATKYGLLGPFVEGMLEARRDPARLVDGYEPSYGYRDPEQLDRARARIRAASPGVETGFGLWLDYDWRAKGWDTGDPSRNHFTPEGFERMLRAALGRTDGVVWVYTEKPRWWTEGGTTKDLPAPYVEALKRVRRDLIPDR